MTVTPNQILLNALSNFGGPNPTTNAAYNELVSAIDMSQKLTTYLNDAFSASVVSGFAAATPNGTGAYYSNGVINLPESAPNILQTTDVYNLIFDVGHEQSHGFTAPDVAAADQAYQTGVASYYQNGSGNLDTLLTQNQQAHGNDEATAQIDGFNSLVSAVSAANPGVNGTALGQLIYGTDTTDARYFLNPDGTAVAGGPTLNTNFIVNQNAQNQTAEASLYYFGPNSPSNLGIFNNNNYTGFEAGYQIGTMLADSPNETLVNSETGLVGLAWSSLREAWFGENAKSLIVIEYETFARDPRTTIARLYKELKEPPFAHDFENIVYDEPDYDATLGMPGLHQVRPKVERQDRAPCIPPDIFATYAESSFWKRPDMNRRGIVIL